MKSKAQSETQPRAAEGSGRNASVQSSLVLDPVQPGCGHSFMCFHGVGRPRAGGWIYREERLQEIWGSFIFLSFFGHTSGLQDQFLSCVPAQSLQLCLTPLQAPGTVAMEEHPLSMGSSEPKSAGVGHSIPVRARGQALLSLPCPALQMDSAAAHLRGTRTSLSQGSKWALAVTVQSPGFQGNTLFLK